MIKNKLKRLREEKSSGSFISGSFKSLDIFGERVSLTYNGKAVYKTFCGAFVTMIILLAVAAFSTYKTYRLMNRINPDMSTLSQVRNLNDLDMVSFQEYDFDIAFRTWNDFDASYGFFELNYVDWAYEIDADTGIKSRNYN